MALLGFNAKGVHSVASYTESQRRRPWVYLYINKERKGTESYSERLFGFYVMATARRILMHFMFCNVCLVGGLFEGNVSSVSMCFLLLYHLTFNNDKSALGWFFIKNKQAQSSENECSHEFNSLL